MLEAQLQNKTEEAAALHASLATAKERGDKLAADLEASLVRESAATTKLEEETRQHQEDVAVFAKERAVFLDSSEAYKAHKETIEREVNCRLGARASAALTSRLDSARP